MHSACRLRRGVKWIPAMIGILKSDRHVLGQGPCNHGLWLKYKLCALASKRVVYRSCMVAERRLGSPARRICHGVVLGRYFDRAWDDTRATCCSCKWRSRSRYIVG